MTDKRAEQYAIRFGILDKMQALEDSILAVPNITRVEFDIMHFNELQQVILLPHYSLPNEPESYFKSRHDNLYSILLACANNDLMPTDDSIEDYYDCWYIVRDCGKSWKEVR